jgi:imidazolonepropionase
MRADLVIRNARVLACTGAPLIESGFVAVRDGRIAAVGPMAEAPATERNVDAEGRLLTPGLIDCHTHLVYAGSRALEFELRLSGASYEEIARAGGGIASTVTATRAASEDELLAATLARARVLLAHGVTTVEIKSGYGLDLASELKCLRAARRVGHELGIDVRTTLLAAHAVPPEFKARADAYVDLIVNEIIPAAAREKLADAVDAFCETIGFTPAQTRRVFDAARTHGLPVKLHAEQLSNQRGATLAAAFNALSADHLEYLDDEGVAAMARAGTVAVLLPGAFYCLRETTLPPIDKLRAARVPIAIATDHNPGTSPSLDAPLMMNMACTLFRLTPAEALEGFTRHAARALGLSMTHGTIEAGKQADLALWDTDSAASLVYPIGATHPSRVFVRGKSFPRGKDFPLHPGER